ncbi:MAG: bacillithiol biosynthesis cysteine-adding enzyme BshC [bacterium]|nr:bacillithiol biosynthesis cysteine-adding enzyme BshC [bacterium]
MFKQSEIPLQDSGVLNKLVGDYLNKRESLLPFYSYYPDLSGFKQLLTTQPYTGFNRDVLCSSLLQQAESVSNSSESSLAAIKKLHQKNCYTITTGHQLCLFTGPLYFIYKLFSAVTLAEQLKKEFPENEFVPVYWMAGEDHDFAEVNHFHVNGKKIEWSSEQSGAVGDFKTNELKHVVPQLRESFGISAHANELIALFERSYLTHANLALATRYLVNELFGAYGLVVLDADDRELKSQFRDELSKDLFQNLSYQMVNDSIQKLEAQGYKAQVNPRPINCFYSDKGIRARIEMEGENYRVMGTNLLFSKMELETILKESPEKISPNVVLRPLYQQKILPNLAYVGGPGELAYWLEFKTNFEAMGILFPILVPRKFICIVDKPTASRINKLNLSPTNFFKTEQELLHEVLLRSNKIFDLEKEKERVRELFSEILKKTHLIDQSLDKKVAADLQRALNSLESINTKTNRALRKKSEVERGQIRTVKEKLFPNSVPQERFENFSSFYLAQGPEFFKQISALADPLGLTLSILIEE